MTLAGHGSSPHHPCAPDHLPRDPGDDTDAFVPRLPEEVVDCGAFLHVRISRSRRVHVLSLHGAIDMSNAVLLRKVIDRVIDRESPGGVVVDATAITLGSVRGLTAMVDAATTATAKAVPYAVAGLPTLHLHLAARLWPDRDLRVLSHVSMLQAVAALDGVKADRYPTYEELLAERDSLRRALDERARPA